MYLYTFHVTSIISYILFRIHFVIILLRFLIYFIICIPIKYFNLVHVCYNYGQSPRPIFHVYLLRNKGHLYFIINIITIQQLLIITNKISQRKNIYF